MRRGAPPTADPSAAGRSAVRGPIPGDPRGRGRLHPYCACCSQFGDATVNTVHSQDAESRLLKTAWGIATPPARGPRPRFSWQDVAAASVDIADSEGLSGVSLSAVAARLGLTTTALY